MAETDEFSVEDQLNYEHEVGEGEGEGDESTEMDDPELEAIKARVKAMEEESEKLKELQKEVDMQLSMPAGGGQLNMSLEEKMDVDSRSVYIGNVDYGATAEELEQHFHGCGSINRVTILCNKYDGHPKGFAYVEFTDKDSVQTAMALDDSLFRGRQIKVNTSSCPAIVVTLSRAAGDAQENQQARPLLHQQTSERPRRVQREAGQVEGVRRGIHEETQGRVQGQELLLPLLSTELYRDLGDPVQNVLSSN